MCLQRKPQGIFPKIRCLLRLYVATPFLWNPRTGVRNRGSSGNFIAKWIRKQAGLCPQPRLNLFSLRQGIQIKIFDQTHVNVQWMDFEEYAAQPFVQKYELLKYMIKICRARVEQGYSGFQGLSIKPSFRDGRDFIYFSNQDQTLKNHWFYLMLHTVCCSLQVT